MLCSSNDRYAHQCGKNRHMRIGPQGRSSKVADDHVFLTTGEAVKVTKKDAQGYEGYVIRLKNVSPAAGGINLPWHMVGIHVNGGLKTSELVKFKYEDVQGKAMVCGDIISEWRQEWFMSKLDV